MPRPEPSPEEQAAAKARLMDSIDRARTEFHKANAAHQAYVLGKRKAESELPERVRKSIAYVDAKWPWLRWQ